MRRYLWAIVIVALGVLLLSSLLSFWRTEYPTQESLPPYSRSVHGPIEIQGEQDFTTPGSGSGCECIRGGAGTMTSPYVIAGWDIDASMAEGIHITGTTVYFTIRDVMVRGVGDRYTCIYLYEVQNGRIENSTLSNNYIGVYLFKSEFNTLQHNLILNNTFGVWLEASHSTTVIENEIVDNHEIGLWIRGSNHHILHNTISNNGIAGINLDGTLTWARNNTISGNEITRNRDGSGIILYQADGNILRDNVVRKNGKFGGIILETSGGNLLTANDISENTGDGILMYAQSSNNRIQANRVIGNGDGLTTFDLHDEMSGSSNLWENNVYKTKRPDDLS